MAMRAIKKYFLRNRLLLSIILIYTVLLVLKALGVDVWLPGCLVSELTGHTCFGCGLNRAAIHLLHLDFRQAFVSNPLIYLYVPLIIGWFSYDFYNFRKKLNQPDNEQD